MIENFILGIAQGVAEWLPISSEGVIVLIKTTFFPPGGVEEAIYLALFLHLGTFLAAAIYFRHDVFLLTKSIIRYQDQTTENKKLLTFLIISTCISALVGISLLKFVTQIIDQFETTGRGITVIIGCLLFVTGFLELKAKKKRLQNN